MSNGHCLLIKVSGRYILYPPSSGQESKEM